MKFTCNQQDLIKNINIVSKAISTRTTIPTLKGILFDVKDGKLKMTASDMDITIESTIDVDSTENGTLVVPSSKFIDYIRKLPHENVEITSENNNINIKCLTSSSSIVGMDGSEYPVISYSEEGKNKITLNKDTLSNMIRKTSFAVSLDQTKGVLTGVLLDIDEDSIKTVAIDGFRMAYNKVNEKAERKEKFIILGKLANDINKIFSDIDEDEVEFYYDDKNGLIKLDNVRVSIRFLAGEFIKYNDIIPKDMLINVQVNRNDVINAVERASIMADGKNNTIRLSIRESVMTISSNSEEGGTIEDLLIKKTGDDIEIGFNARYIIDILKVIDDEDIILNFNSPITPCVITPVDGDRFIYMLFPVRINNN